MDNLGIYDKFLDDVNGPGLFLFGITYGNDVFIKEVLRKSIFDKNIFKQDNVVEKIIETLEDGSKTNFILNTLNMIDISVWGNDKIGDLLDSFTNFVEQIFD
mgnify:CR=1 FL=1|jgi:hypothetical protein